MASTYERSEFSEWLVNLIEQKRQELSPEAFETWMQGCTEGLAPYQLAGAQQPMGEMRGCPPHDWDATVCRRCGAKIR